MVRLGFPHVAPSRGRFDRHTFRCEGFEQRLDGRLAAEVDHRARPIEDHQVETITETHFAASPSNRLAITSSPMANPVDAPAPDVTVAMRTYGCGASTNTCRS